NHRVVGIWVGVHSRERRGGGGGKCSAIDAEVSQHPGIARDRIGGQAQFAVEYWKGRSAGGRHIDLHIVGLARREEDFALHAGNTRQGVAVFSNQAEPRG